jgi:putative PEP-CTERM system TPR-repeat lipoprotein
VSAALLAGCTDSPEEMLESAKVYLAKNDLNAASIQLKNALQENGKLAEGRFLLGKINLEQGDMPGAAKEFERALEFGYASEEVTPLLARALLQAAQVDRVIKDYAGTTLSDQAAQTRLLTVLGEAYLAKAMVAEAGKAFEAALALSPDDDLARVGLGRSKLASGDAGAAQAEAETVTSRKADLAEAQVLLADALMVQGKSDEAVTALEAAVKAKPKSVSHHFALASLLLRQNKIEEATKALEAMQAFAPKHPSTLYVQAFLDFRADRLTEARSSIEAVLKNAPNFLPGELLAGALMLRLNEHLLAQQHLSKVLASAPRQVMARRLLASSYLATGNAPRALEVIQPLVPVAERIPGVSGLLGQIFLAMGEHDKAETYFAQAAKSAPDDAGARARLGVARLAGGDAERAFADLEMASGLDESSGQADLALILAHMQRNEFDKAMDAWKTLEAKLPENPQTYNLKGGVLLAKRDIPGAREAFEKSLQLKPDFLAAAVNLSRLDLADSKPDVAKARFERILKDNPKNVEALLAYADLQAATATAPAEVLATLERAIAAGPGVLPAQLALINQHLKMRDTAKAMTVAQQAAAAKPEDPRALEALARVQLAAGETQQAIATLNKLVGVQPQSPAPLVMLADVQRQIKDDTAAEQSLLKALALKPDLLEAQQRLIGIQVSRGDRAAALSTAKRVQQQRPTAMQGYLFEGDILGSEGKWAEAVSAYRKALERGKSGEIVSKLHSALVRAERKPEADKLVADWLRNEPKDLVVRGYVAERALAEKRYADALQMFRSMNELSPKNALILNNLAWSAAAAKDGQALTYAEQALALAPDNPVVLDTVGVIQVDSGQAEKGLANLERAVSLAPELAPLRLNLAKSYAKLDRKADARKALEVLMPKLTTGTPIHAEASDLLKSL